MLHFPCGPAAEPLPSALALAGSRPLPAAHPAGRADLGIDTDERKVRPPVGSARGRGRLRPRPRGRAGAGAGPRRLRRRPDDPGRRAPRRRPGRSSRDGGHPQAGPPALLRAAVLARPARPRARAGPFRAAAGGRPLRPSASPSAPGARPPSRSGRGCADRPGAPRLGRLPPSPLTAPASTVPPSRDVTPAEPGPASGAREVRCTHAEPPCAKEVGLRFAGDRALPVHAGAAPATTPAVPP
jgi:hypothetical protein